MSLKTSQKAKNFIKVEISVEVIVKLDLKCEVVHDRKQAWAIITFHCRRVGEQNSGRITKLFLYCKEEVLVQNST